MVHPLTIKWEMRAALNGATVLVRFRASDGQCLQAELPAKEFNTLSDAFQKTKRELAAMGSKLSITESPKTDGDA